MSDRRDFFGRLEAAMKAKSPPLNMSRLAKISGVDRTTLYKYQKDRSRQPQGRTLTSLARALDVSESWLLSGSERPEPGTATAEPASSETRTRDLMPVLGSASGSLMPGLFAIDPSEVVEWRPKPWGVRNVHGVYALYVQGDSMAPEHPHGALRVMHPTKPLRAGDSVIVQEQRYEDGPITASIGNLVQLKAESVVIEKHQPKGRHVEILRPHKVHKVLTDDELIGY